MKANKVTLWCLLAVGGLIHLAGAQNFSLPALPYAYYGAMEPFIDATTMDIHWNRHTQTYVNNLNAALARCPSLGGVALNQLVQRVGVQGAIDSNCLRDVRNNGGGVYNHVLFFLHSLAPAGSQSWDNDASPALKKAISDAFGSLDSFKKQFKQAASSIFGSGWAWLCMDQSTKAVNITTTPNQDNTLMKVAPLECLPILGLDNWEHAYYLRYQNKRADYIDSWWNVTNWRGASTLYEQQAASGQPATLL